MDEEVASALADLQAQISGLQDNFDYWTAVVSSQITALSNRIYALENPSEPQAPPAEEE